MVGLMAWRWLPAGFLLGWAVVGFLCWQAAGVGSPAGWLAGWLLPCCLVKLDGRVLASLFALLLSVSLPAAVCYVT